MFYKGVVPWGSEVVVVLTCEARLGFHEDCSCFRGILVYAQNGRCVHVGTVVAAFQAGGIQQPGTSRPVLFGGTWA